MSQLRHKDLPDQNDAVDDSAAAATVEVQDPPSTRDLVSLDHSDQRLLRQAEAHRAAKALSATPLLADRIDLYNKYGKRIINLAACLYPELMPRLNGEFEHLELTRADHD